MEDKEPDQTLRVPDIEDGPFFAKLTGQGSH